MEKEALKRLPKIQEEKLTPFKKKGEAKKHLQLPTQLTQNPHNQWNVQESRDHHNSILWKLIIFKRLNNMIWLCWLLGSWNVQFIKVWAWCKHHHKIYFGFLAMLFNMIWLCWRLGSWNVQFIEVWAWCVITKSFLDF